MAEQDIHKREKIKKGRIFEIIAYLLGIMIISLSITSMILTGGNLDDFYHVGKSHKLDENTMNYYSVSGMVYRQETSLMEVTENESITVMLLPADIDKYQFLEVQMYIPDGKAMQVQMVYYNELGNVLYESDEEELVNGLQYLSVSNLNPGVSRIAFRVNNQVGKQFWIESVYLRETVKDWGMAEFAGLTLLCTAVVCILTCVVHRLNRRKSCLGEDFTNGIWKVIGKVADLIAIPFPGRSKLKRLLRTLLFAIMLFALQYLDMRDDAVLYSTAVIRYVVCSVILLAICILSRENKTVRQSKGGLFLKLWILQSIICMCSEFIVEKNFWGRGVFMLGIMGLFFYTWSHMVRPEKMLLDFTRGMEITFWINIGYCFVFEPYSQAQRYTGFVDNTNIFMMYLLPELVVVLFGIYRNWREQKYAHMLIRSVGGGVGILYLNMTECRTGILGIILAVMILAMSVLIQWKWVTKIQKIALAGVIFCVAAGAYFALVSGETVEVYALGRFIESIKYSENLNRFSSGRIYIYQKYLEQMNLWGHDFREEFYTGKLDAHNGILTMGYLYGILVIMPYFVWLILYVKNAIMYWREGLKKNIYSIFPFLVVSAMLPVVLIENLEQFLRWPVWILLYFTAGIVIQREGNCETDKRKI